MKIIIEQKDNGAMMTIDNQDPDSRPSEQVYEFDEYTSERLADMLWEIADNFHLGHKRMEKLVYVEVRHGLDWECKKKDCEICIEK